MTVFTEINSLLQFLTRYVSPPAPNVSHSSTHTPLNQTERVFQAERSSALSILDYLGPAQLISELLARNADHHARLCWKISVHTEIENSTKTDYDSW
jgi:hypothetical protein